MRRLLTAVVIACTAALVGCSDNSTAPRDVTPPASPQGLYSVTGDRTVTLRWVANTEPDLAGYRIYQAACASGPDCPYTRIAVATTNQYVLTGLTNGIKRYYAVTAVDHAGNESALSAGDVFDTPRPAGTNALLGNALEATATAGWRFATAGVVASTDPTCDVYFGHNGSIAEMFATDVQTDIQDAGYSTTLDHVDYAPPSGWSPTGSVELIVKQPAAAKA